jgi:hypothetical protein
MTTIRRGEVKYHIKPVQKQSCQEKKKTFFQFNFSSRFIFRSWFFNKEILKSGTGSNELFPFVTIRAYKLVKKKSPPVIFKKIV